MDFVVHGTLSPRTSERNLPSSARPGSARPQVTRNPITGEETPVRPSSRAQDYYSSASRPQSRPQGVPTLNLNYLQDGNDLNICPFEISDQKYDDGPPTASTVSWGTARSDGFSARKPQQSSRNSKVTGIPGLQLNYDTDSKPTKQPIHKPSTPKPPTPKEPSAWDKQPISENLPSPSSQYKELYDHYRENAKLAVKKHTHPVHVTEDDVSREVDALKRAHPKYTEEEDEIQDSWAKKHTYSKTQWMKKLDAEAMLENNKKEKLIETVMIDQLSRAVISDPEQNSRTMTETDTRRHRGSHRFLHESKIRTTGTATENLLSKRVRFGARVVTRDGHDACRELTGFFFHADNSLTIYEFRQFGKSAKALPFITRGQYCHLSGHRKGQPYTLTDLCAGSTLEISMKGQHSLPDTIKKFDKLLFKVTEVAEEEKQGVLLQSVRSSEREEVYARLHIPGKHEHQDRRIIAGIQGEVQRKIKKRAIRTVAGLGRYYRKVDSSGEGILYRFDLEKGLFEFRIELSPEKLDAVFEIIDCENAGELDYGEYMCGVLGEMKESRKTLVRKAFKKLDSSKTGKISVSEIKKFFNANFQPARKEVDSMETSALQAFLDAVRGSARQEEVSYMEFVEYYEGCSIGIEDDEDFANLLRNTWTI